MTIFDRLRYRLETSSLLKRWYSSCPRLFDFLASLANPARRPLAFGLIIAAVFWFSFFGVVQDYIADDPLVQADLRVMFFVQTLREPAYNSVMLFLTYLGNWQVISVGSVVFAILMYLSRQWWWLGAFAASILGEQIISQVAKFTFHRARPNLDNALLAASGNSFPSGHALVAFAFYGFIACYAMAQTRSWWGKTLILASVVPLILGIGFSRIYLGVHWPSDVIASFALGPAWVTTVFIVFGLTWEQPSQENVRPLLPLAIIAGAVVWMEAAIAVFLSHPLSARAVTPKQVFTLNENDIDTRLFDYLPRFTEDFTGAHIEPINVIVVGSFADLNRTFADAGWVAAAPLSITSGFKLVVAEITNSADPNAPGLPVFLNSLPNDWTFERSTAQNSARERHHLHLWSTNLTGNGVPVWVGTVHLDVSGTLYRRLTYHMIAPGVDQARDEMTSDLRRSSCVAADRVINVTPPMEGQNTFHNSFFTDGRAIQFILNCGKSSATGR